MTKSPMFLVWWYVLWRNQINVWVHLFRGAYNNMAKGVRDKATLRSAIMQRLVNQTLDDMVATAPVWSGGVERSFDSYRLISTALGVRLASKDDLDNVFRSTYESIFHGISSNIYTCWWFTCRWWYDATPTNAESSERWQWSLKNDITMSLNRDVTHY